MRVAYTAPAKDERYLIEKKAAYRIARSLCPDLPLLAFQTMHVPKMTEDVPYLVTFSKNYIRVLSIKPEWINQNLQLQFLEQVFPYICKTVVEWQRLSYSWPSVVVALDGQIYSVSCSDGWMMPNQDEIFRKIKTHTRLICHYIC